MKSERPGGEPRAAAIYVRVSTKGQDYQRQINDLKREAQKQSIEVVEVISEKITRVARHKNRPAIQKILSMADTGTIDTLLVTEVSRTGANVTENLQLLNELTSKGVSIYAQDMGMHTLQNGKLTMVAEILIAVYSSLARTEREKLRERVLSGLEEAKRQGKQLGRPIGTKDITSTKNYKIIVRSLEKGLSMRETMKVAGVSLETVRKVKNSLISARCTGEK